MCPHFSSALSKFKCLVAKHSCLNPLWTYFLVTFPRLDPNDGITARGCAWMSPEETVAVFVQCLYTDVPKTSISNFRNRFLRRTSTSQDRFALRQLLWPDYSTYKSFDLSAKVIPSLTIPEWAQFSKGHWRKKQKTMWHWLENLHENLVPLLTYLSFHLILRS